MPHATINGAVLVGMDSRRRESTSTAVKAASDEVLGPPVSEATADDIADACQLAQEAAEAFTALELDARARFIETAAQAILDIGDLLIETAMAETGLPPVRLECESTRTVNQLRLFADEVRAGHWLKVTIDQPGVARSHAARGPEADERGNRPGGGIRRLQLPAGVLGGGRRHRLGLSLWLPRRGQRPPGAPPHQELVARAVGEAVRETGLTPGVFSYLPGTTHELGSALVADPRINAVGFTGPRGGGLALVASAAKREEPIPVYAEISSINPVVLLPGALPARAEALGPVFAGSLALGSGQFCTNSGWCWRSMARTSTRSSNPLARR